MKNFLLLLLLAFAAFSCRAQAVYQLSVLPVCWSYAENQDSTLYAYWLMSSRQEEPRLMSYLNVAGQVVSVAPGSLSPGPCCCDGGSGGNLDSLSIGVVQDSIIVLYNAGVEISRDTVYFAPGSPISLDTCSVARVVEDYQWTSQISPLSNWLSVCYGNGLFVAVANGGTNRVMTSTDGITWTARNAAAANSWNSVTYGNGLFVAVAINGALQVMTSTDGITWTGRNASNVASWSSVTYGNGLFVAVANNGIANRVMTSADGITWTARNAAENNIWRSVTYGNGLFVAVGSGNNPVMTSTDGITWTARGGIGDNTWFSVAYGNGSFVAVASSDQTAQVMTSTDGITWTGRNASELALWRSVAYGNGLFASIANNGAGNRAMYSLDGILWTSSIVPSSSWTSVCYGNGLFAAVASAGTTRVMTASLTTQIQCPENPYGGDNTMQGIIDSLYANQGGGGGGSINVIASNGLNDADPSANVDVELGGNLDRDTRVGGRGAYDMIWDSLAQWRVSTRISGIQDSTVQYQSPDYYTTVVRRLADLVRITLDNRIGSKGAEIVDISGDRQAGLATFNSEQVTVSASDLSDGTSVGIIAALIPVPKLVLNTPNAGSSLVQPGMVPVAIDSLGAIEFQDISGGGGSGPTYTAGAGIAINGSNVISAVDNSATNEIQTLSLSGNILELSSGGGNVDLEGYNNSNVTANLGLGTATSTTREITSSIGTSATLPSATTTLAGLMSGADKTKLDGLTPGGTNLSTTNLTQTDGARTYTYTGTLSFLGGTSLLLQSTALNIGRAGQAQTAAIPTLSPQGATMGDDPTGFIRVVNWNGTLAGTGYRSINDLFSLVTRDQFPMRSVASAAVTTTRYNSTTPLVLSGVPTSLIAGYAFQSSLTNRGFVGLNSSNITTLTGNADVLVESPTAASLKSAGTAISVEPAAIEITVGGGGVLIMTGVPSYPDTGSASGLPAGALFTVNGVLHIAQQ